MAIEDHCAAQCTQDQGAEDQNRQASGPQRAQRLPRRLVRRCFWPPGQHAHCTEQTCNCSLHTPAGQLPVSGAAYSHVTTALCAHRLSLNVALILWLILYAGRGMAMRGAACCPRRALWTGWSACTARWGTHPVGLHCCMQWSVCREPDCMQASSQLHTATRFSGWRGY